MLPAELKCLLQADKRFLLLQAKDNHMFVEEQIDEYFPELLRLPGM